MCVFNIGQTTEKNTKEQIGKTPCLHEIYILMMRKRK